MTENTWNIKSKLYWDWNGSPRFLSFWATINPEYGFGWIGEDWE